MEQATLSPADSRQITRLAITCVKRLGCLSARMTHIGIAYEGAYRVTLIGTIAGQLLEMQALVIHERQDRYSCENCWVSRHA